MAGGKKAQASVSLDSNGKLKYTPDERGNRIPDFFRAGYMGGGVKIPDVPVKLTLEPRPGMPKELAEYDSENPDAAGEGDDTERIQKAIDKVSAMELDEKGFRGAVLLKRGPYRTSKTLTIRASGVVLRGEGQAKDDTVILCTAKQRMPVIDLRGNRELTEVKGSRREIADAYVPWGVKSFNLKSADGLAVGDKVIVFRPSTKQWLEELKMTKIWKWKHNPRAFDLHYEREIVEVKGKRITLDASTANAMEDKYGGGFVYKYTEKGAISQVGVKHVRLISAGEPDMGFTFSGCVNAWGRNITGLNFLTNLVRIGRSGNCKFITVQDCAYLDVPGKKGSKSAFIFYRAQLCLIQRGYAAGGRHTLSCSAKVQGPCVYLDMYSKGWDAGPHHRYSTGILYDNVSVKGYLVAQNRGKMGSGHGWAGAQIVFWNCDSYKRAIHQPPAARNYNFGGSPKFKYGRKIVGSAVEPRSLYLKQLENRLGREAVENVTTEAQRKAVSDPKSEWSKRKVVLWDAMRLGIGEADPEKKDKKE